MAKINLIITADYEVYGNGSGCVINCLIKPTDELLKVANRYKIPVTFFVDVCEIWAFEAVEEAGLWDLDYSPSALIKEQLKNAIKDGHDVQLHFHPQWLEYEYLGKGKWRLNHDLWRLPSLETERLEALFRKGKQWMEDTFRSVQPNYRCEIFRAGGWCIQPEEEVLRIMAELGFRVDSTVAPGCYELNENRFFDFRQSPEKASWKIRNSVMKEEEGVLTEIPIFTTNVSVMRRIWFEMGKRIRRIPGRAKNCSGYSESSSSKSKFDKGRQFLKQGRKMLNFSDGTSSAEMIWIMKQAIKKFEADPGNVPVVMIGHPKSFGDGRELDFFIKKYFDNSRIAFVTFCLNTQKKFAGY